MRVAYLALIELDVPNACVIHTREVAEQMAELGNEVHLFLPMPLAGQRWKNVQHHWVRFWGFDTLRGFLFLAEACIRLAFTHFRQPFDVLYLREFERPRLLIRVCSWLKLPFFVEVNGWQLDDLKLLGAGEHQLELARRDQQTLFSSARGIVADIEGNAVSVARYYGQSEEKIHVQDLGVNAGLFSNVDRDDARQQLGIDTDAHVVLFTGSFHPHHDLHTLIQAFALAYARAPQLILILVGDGSQRRSAEAWVREAGVEDEVRFAGLQSYHDMPIWFAVADMFVSPLLKRKVERQNSACATKIWEAMAAGIGVIVTDMPQTASYEMLQEMAWVVPPEDPEAMAEAMVHMIGDEERYQRVTTQARVYVQTQRSWNKAAADILHFISLRLQ